jgi:DNA end-binding protein Ku
MPRAVWTGGLSFGLVRIPVALYPATEPKDVRFHMVDRATGARVRYRRVVELDDDAGLTHRIDSVEPDAVIEASDRGAPDDDLGDESPDDRGEDDRAHAEQVAPPPATARREVEVAYEDLARGYQIDADRSVILEREEIERIRPRRSETIDIDDFVELGDIDPVYFEKSYFLGPRPGAEKPYTLLQRALDRAGKVGIGRFVLRTKPHLVAIRPTTGVLGLETLYFGDEVRDPSAIARHVAGVEMSARELAMAEQLVEMLATEWDPSRYSDEYREELLNLVASKAPVSVEEPRGVAAEHPGIDQLMEALKQSVERVKQERGNDGPAKPKPAKRASRRHAG